jgi:hypothetical protein
VEELGVHALILRGYPAFIIDLHRQNRLSGLGRGHNHNGCMFHIGYVSSAVREFTKAELLDLLKRSREKNKRLGITGILLYRGGNFMQVLEGEEQSVRYLYEIIYEDPRHKDIFILFEEFIREREFPNWSMAFRDVDTEDCRSIPGFSSFLDLPWTAENFSSDRSKARAILAGFRENLR